MSSYTPVGWANDETHPVSQANLKTLDQGVVDVDALLATVQSASRRRRETTNFDVPDNTGTIVPMNGVDYDYKAGNWSLSSSSEETIVTPGIYRITAGVVWGINSTGIRRLAIRAGGTVVAVSRANATASGTDEQNITVDVALVLNDTVEVDVTQTSGGTLAVTASAATFRALQLIRPT